MTITWRARTLLHKEGRVASTLSALARDSLDEATAASLQGFTDDCFSDLAEPFVWYVMNNSTSTWIMLCYHNSIDLESDYNGSSQDKASL